MTGMVIGQTRLKNGSSRVGFMPPPNPFNTPWQTRVQRYHIGQRHVADRSFAVLSTEDVARIANENCGLALIQWQAKHRVRSFAPESIWI